MTNEKRNVELTLEKAKEWYKKGGELREVALQAFTEAELMGRPYSVAEGLKNYRHFFGDRGYYIAPTSFIAYADARKGFDETSDRNILPTQELAEAMLALTQLVTWRRAWVVDWKPNWLNHFTPKFCIEFFDGEFRVSEYTCFALFFSFPTEKMATGFLATFKDLFEQTRPLFE